MTTPRDVIHNTPLFSEYFLTIQAKDGALRPLAFKPVQHRLLRSLTGRDIVLKARQVGVSTAIQAEVFRRLITEPTMALTFAHLHEPTRILRERMDLFWREWPSHPGAPPRPARYVNNATTQTFPEYNSTHRVATANSPGMRGGASNYAHLTEAAFYRNFETMLSALQPMAHGPIVIESTPNGADGLFYDMCMRALRGEGEYALHFIAWWDEPEYTIPLSPGETLDYTTEEYNLVTRHGLTPGQIKWRRHAIGSNRRFLQEFPEDPISCFLVSGNSFFGDVSHALVLPTTAGTDGVVTLEGATPQPDHVYVAGIDWGQTDDHTVCIVYDITDRVQVAMLRINQMSYPVMRRRVADLLVHWRVRTVTSEANTGMNSINTDELRNLLFQERREGRLDRPITINGFVTTNATKAEAAGALYEALHARIDGVPFSQWFNDRILKAEFQGFEEHKTPGGGYTLRHKDGGHDDTVIAAMLAYQAALRNPRMRRQLREAQ